MHRFRLRAISAQRSEVCGPWDLRRWKTKLLDLSYGELRLLGVNAAGADRDPLDRSGEMVIGNVVSLDHYRRQRVASSAPPRSNEPSPPTTAS